MSYPKRRIVGTRAAAGGVLAAVTLLSAGCAGSAEGGGGTSATQAGASSGRDSSSQEKPDLKLTSVIDSEYYKSLTPEQQKTIKKLHDMDVPTFEQQPVDVQRMYSRFARDAYRGYTTQMINDVDANGITPGTPTTPAPVDASPEDIIKSDKLESAIPCIMLTRDMDPWTVHDENRPDAIKTYLGMATNTDAFFVKAGVSNLNTISEMNGNLYYSHVKTASLVDSSVTPSGTPRRVIDVSVTETDDGLNGFEYDRTYDVRYSFFKDIKGNRIGEWLTESIQRS